MKKTILRFLNNVRTFLLADELISRLLRNSSWLFRSNIITTGLRFFQAIILARFLGAGTYGIYATITTSTIVVNQLTGSRVWETAIKFTTKYQAQDDNERSKAVIKLSFLIDMVTGSLSFLLLIIASGFISRNLIKDPSYEGLIQLYALWNLATIPIDTSSAILRLADRFNWWAYYNIAEATIRLLAIGVAIASIGNLESILLAMLVSTSISSIIIFIQACRAAKVLGLDNWHKSPLSSLNSDLWSLIRFTLTSNINETIKLLKGNIDVLLVGFFLDPIHAGYVKLGRSISDLMRFPSSPVYAASYPEFVRLWHQGMISRVKSYFIKLTVPSIIYAGLSIIGVIVLAPTFIQIVGGSEYLPATSTLRWFAAGTAIAIALNFGHPLLASAGAISRSFYAQLSGIIVQMLVLVVLIPKFGAASAGIALLIANLIWGGMISFSIYQLFWMRNTSR